MAQARPSPFDDSAMTDVPVSLNATEYTVEPCGTRPFVRAGVRQDLSRRLQCYPIDARHVSGIPALTASHRLRIWPR